MIFLNRLIYQFCDRKQMRYMCVCVLVIINYNVWRLREMVICMWTAFFIICIYILLLCADKLSSNWYNLFAHAMTGRTLLSRWLYSGGRRGWGEDEKKLFGVKVTCLPYVITFFFSDDLVSKLADSRSLKKALTCMCKFFQCLIFSWLKPSLLCLQ